MQGSSSVTSTGCGRARRPKDLQGSLTFTLRHFVFRVAQHGYSVWEAVVAIRLSCALRSVHADRFRSYRFGALRAPPGLWAAPPSPWAAPRTPWFDPPSPMAGSADIVWGLADSVGGSADAARGSGGGLVDAPGAFPPNSWTVVNSAGRRALAAPRRVIAPTILRAFERGIAHSRPPPSPPCVQRSGPSRAKRWPQPLNHGGADFCGGMLGLAVDEALRVAALSRAGSGGRHGRSGLGFGGLLRGSGDMMRS